MFVLFQRLSKWAEIHLYGIHSLASQKTNIFVTLENLLHLKVWLPLAFSSQILGFL